MLPEMILAKNLRAAGAPPPFDLEELSVGSAPEAFAAARALLLEYGDFVRSQPKIAGFCFGSLEREAERLPESYWEQGGGAIVASLLATEGRAAAGFVAWRRLPRSAGAGREGAERWELKRLWTRPSARGTGMGSALVEAVIQRARAAEMDQLLLDTAPWAMPAAYRLYRKAGFRECAPYSGEAKDGIVYMQKHL